MNVLNFVKPHLTAQSLKGFSDLVEVNATMVPKLIERGLPVILTALSQGATDPSKSGLVNQLLSQSDAEIVKNSKDEISEKGAELVKSGKATLAKLLGPKLTDHIAPIAETTDLGEGKIASALGLLTPFVIAILGKEAQTASKLTRIFADDEEFEELTVPENQLKKSTTAEKSYVPDPTKKRERRPFPKRKVMMNLLLLASIIGALYILIHTGVIEASALDCIGQKASELWEKFIPSASQPTPE